MKYCRSFPGLDVCSRSHHTSDCAKEVLDVILANMDPYNPFLKKCPSNSKPWFDRKCKAAVSSKHLVYQQYRKNPNVINRNIETGTDAKK